MENEDVFEPKYHWLCCSTYKDRAKFERALVHLQIDALKKDLIRSRYIGILENFQKRARNHAIVYFMGHFVITVGSLFVPALLSIQNSTNSYVFGSSDFAVHIYWATFIISLLVTIFNGILTLFKIDKKYYFLHTTLEKLRSEGWQYVGLTGRYAGQLLPIGATATHENQFLYFSHAVEKIKMKQVEEEYYKTDEHAAHAQAQAQAAPSSKTSPNMELYPPSPNQPLPKHTPPPINKVVRSIIRSQPMPLSRSPSRTTIEISSIAAEEEKKNENTPVIQSSYHRSDPLIEDGIEYENTQKGDLASSTLPVSSNLS